MDNGGPAFPIAPNPHYGKGPSAEPRGMTLRDYFAAQALSGLIEKFHGAPLDIPDLAYSIADGMLMARQR